MGEARGYRDYGREGALEALAADRALVVVGPSGCGRSALLTDLAAYEEGRRRVWWCRGHHVAGPSADEVLRFGPDDVDAQLRAAAESPTTVLVDDAHLLDRGVLDGLVSLAERRHDLDLRMAVARRSGGSEPALGRLEAVLLGPGGALHLGPLTIAGVAAWLADVGADAADAAGILARTGGWPELVAAEIGAPGSGVADLVTARLALLDPEHRRVVRALSFDLPVGSGALTEATGADHDGVDVAVDAALTAGLLHQPTAPIAGVAAAVRATTPAGDRARIAAAALACGPAELILGVARHLGAAGDRSREAGAVFERAAGILGPAGALETIDLLEAAIRAGRPAGPLAAGRATAALAAGRAEDAVTLATRAVAAAVGDAAEATSTVDDPEAPRVMTVAEATPAVDGAALRRVAGGAWAHMASPDLAADCYLATGDHRVLATLPLLALGRSDEAAAVLAASRAGTDAGNDPAAEGARSLAEASLAWIAGDEVRAIAAFERSAQLTQVHGGIEDWPDSPHAVLALAATQVLDIARAERMARTALERSVGGRPFARRHQLLLAWVALRGGRLDEARAALDAVPEPPRDMVRDAVTAAAVAAALALRTAEPQDLPQVHLAASRLVGRARPDPFAADLAGELAHLAARVGDDPEPVLGPLERLAVSLGSPPAVTVPLAWARLMVAVARDDGGGARRAARSLAEARRAAETAGAAIGDMTHLLAEAARVFAEVLAEAVDPDEVHAMAARLTERGMVFEASRLVGAASLRCRDATATRSLLSELRRLRATQVRVGARRSRPAVDLSEREREVARALLDGHTHREIGARLYISAKTVEHHVARIRQKLGATTTRADLLAAIRDELERADPPPAQSAEAAGAPG